MWDRLKLFLNPFDARFEDMRRDNWLAVAVRDTSAGLIVAMMAIPMAMGFAMAAGLRPEHGILAGAIAGLVGALFGGSKYNVYGPVAALIPVIASIMAAYRTPDDPFAGHGFLVLICMCSGPILMLLGLVGWGRVGNLVPHSIVVGFSVGIAVTIALTQFGEVLGLKAAVSGGFLTKLRIIGENLHQANGSAMLLALLTFIIVRSLLKVSIFIPAPLLALGVGLLLSSTVLKDDDLTLIETKYGEIPTNYLMVTPPELPSWDLATLADLAFYALAFAFVCGFESLLAARMGDRLADNQGTPYNPNKECWGQGLIQTLVPLLNGMPLSGALARTATNIKVGAVTPLAGIMKCVLKLTLAFFLAHYLELVPMACIGGILLWVSANMVKPTEIKQIWAQDWFHAGLMIYTAVMVIVTDFLTGVLSAMAIYGVLYKFLERRAPGTTEQDSPLPAAGVGQRDGKAIARAPALTAQPLLGARKLPGSKEIFVHRYRRLMVGLARAHTDAGLVRYAAMVARLSAADKICFVHVLPNFADPSTALDRDRVLAELQAEVQPHITGVPETARVSYDVLQGPLVDQLLACAAEKEVDLLLVGHGVESPGRKALARRLAMKAPCSVWMVPDGSPAALGRVLVPIDFSEPAADAMRVAASMARLSGNAECLALHVGFDEAVITYEEDGQAFRGREEEAYRQFIAPINGQGMNVTPLFEEGVNVPHVIGRAAERHGADLIVMATRGRSQSAAVLLGSVTEEMIIETRVPLLAVKHFGARLGVLRALLEKSLSQRGGLHTD